jgi:hypothetical protein
LFLHSYPLPSSLEKLAVRDVGGQYGQVVRNPDVFRSKGTARGPETGIEVYIRAM